MILVRWAGLEGSPAYYIVFGRKADELMLSLNWLVEALKQM